jgi:predicted amidophosphoribosyltransferase
MARELCDNCGNYLPNAVGADVYCNHCGEPVKKPKK